MVRRHNHKQRTAKSRRLGFELLETRALLAGNLELTGAMLVDGNDQPIAAPVFGETTQVRVEWRSTDIVANSPFRVRVAIDNVPLDSPQIMGVVGTNAAQSQVVGGWIATPGSHTVQVSLDSDGSIAETNEADNVRSFPFTAATPTSLPAKLSWPVGGQQIRDWSITDYVDLDPRVGNFADYRGGPFSYDGHLGLDAMLTNFSKMDSGVPVFSAAAGVVTEVAGGYFDDRGPTSGRACDLPSPQVCANRVLIDLGQNWFAEYVHLEQGSITVRPGDHVTAGQLLGLTGGSGTFNEGAHLHFALWHGPDRVETFVSPSDYWLNPPAYEGSLPPRVVDSGITNLFDPAADFAERPSSVNIFPTSYTGKIIFWTSLSHLLPGDTVFVRWFRPNGDLDNSFGGAVSLPIIHRTYPWENISDWFQNPGQWLVTLDINGTEAARATFQISSQQTVPELRVTQGGKQIVDERLTPIDFGSVPTGAAPPQQTFVIKNHGSAPLTIANWETPPGYSVVGAVPASVAPHQSASVTLQLDTTRAGRKFGQVRFRTNDADESRFNFYVAGDVTGADPAGAPRITLTDVALGVSLGDAAQVLDAEATIADADSANFGGGRLTVEFAGGEAPHDQLAIRNQGAETGQIGVAADRVQFGGVEIGSFLGGSDGVPLDVSLNSSATLAAVQALQQAITFVNSPAVSVTVPRFVRFTIVDDAQHASNQPVKMIVMTGAAPNQLPSISAPADSVTSQNTTTPSLTITIGDTETPAGSLTLSATSSNAPRRLPTRLHRATGINPRPAAVPLKRGS